MEGRDGGKERKDEERRGRRLFKLKSQLTRNCAAACLYATEATCPASSPANGFVSLIG